LLAILCLRMPLCVDALTYIKDEKMAGETTVTATIDLPKGDTKAEANKEEVVTSDDMQSIICVLVMLISGMVVVFVLKEKYNKYY